MDNFYISSVGQINIREILNDLEYDENDVIFVGGSLVEGEVSVMSKGMGNRLSDLDLFILTSNLERHGYSKEDYDTKKIKTRFKKINGLHIDIEIVDFNSFDEILDQLNIIQFGQNERSTNLLKLSADVNIRDMMSVVHRFLNSIPIHNEKKYEKLKNEININNYFNYKKRVAVNVVDNMYTDVIGNLDCRQYEVANYIARRMLIFTIESYLYYNHISLDREKWILLLFRNLSEKNEEAKLYYNKFKTLFFQSTLLNDSDFKMNSEDILGLSNSIIDSLGGI